MNDTLVSDNLTTEHCGRSVEQADVDALLTIIGSVKTNNNSVKVTFKKKFLTESTDTEIWSENTKQAKHDSKKLI